MFLHNQKTLNEVIQYIEKNQNCCVVNDCGTGKSQIMAKLIETYSDKTFLIITQQKNAIDYFKGLSDAFKRNNVCIVTYAKMVSDVKHQKIQRYKADFYLLDEAHYVGAPQRSKAFESLQDIYDPRIIGFTATPQRYSDQGTDRTIVSTFFSNNYAGRVKAKDLAEDGLMVEPDYYMFLWNLHDIIDQKIQQILNSSINESDKKHYIKKLRLIAQTTPSLQNKLKSILPDYLQKKTDNRVLVYTANISDLEEKKNILNKYFHDIFPDRIIKDYTYTYKTSESVLDDFCKDEVDIKIIYSINKIMETIHFDSLNVIFMLRPSISQRIITQQFGRINSLQNKEKTAIIDMVNNLNNLHQSNMGYRHNIHTKTNKYRSYTTLPEFKEIIGIFNAIDKITTQTQHYTYKGFEGSLKELCYVYDKDYNDMVDKLTQYYFIDVAMDYAKTIPINSNAATNNPIDFDFTLTDEMKQIAENNMYMVENFIKKHNIQDDELEQILYCQYLQTIYTYADSDLYLSMIVPTSLRKTQLLYLKKQNRQQLLHINCDIADMDIEDDNNVVNMIESNDFCETILEIAEYACTSRQYNFLRERFDICRYENTFITNQICSYPDLGKKHNITNVRVRTIVYKAIKNINDYIARYGLRKPKYIRTKNKNNSDTHTTKQ